MALSFLKTKESIIKNEKNVLESKYNFFTLFFKDLLLIEKNDKIGIIMNNNNNNIFEKINFTLYLDKYNFYQSIRRWYNKQKREEIFDKLDILFKEYEQFILNLKHVYMHYALYLNIIELNKKLIIKLELLKNTYNDINIDDHIDNYIIMLKYY
jgi:hypothetical protein